MLELFVVRHGESVRNHACLLAHRGDDELLRTQLAEMPDEAMWPLTERGRSQARAAGRWLSIYARSVHTVYSSPYRRTLETLNNLELGIKPILDPRIKEREWGEYPLGSYSVSEYLADLGECGSFHWRSRFPRAESIADLLPSTERFLNDVLRTHDSGQVVIVTHGGRMQALEHVIEGCSCARRYGNCSVLRYRFEASGIFVGLENPAQPELSPLNWQPVREPVRMSA